MSSKKTSQLSLFEELKDPAIWAEPAPAPVVENPLAEANPEPGAKLTYEDFNYERLLIYAGIDCITTSGVLIELMPMLTETVSHQTGPKSKNPALRGPVVTDAAVIDSVDRIEMPSHEFVLDLEINGLDYSVLRNQFYDRKMTEQIAELDDKIFSGIGKVVDLNSGPAVAKFLYEERGFKVPFKTKAGEPATDGVALLSLAGLNPNSKRMIAADPKLQWLVDMAIRKDIASVHNTFIRTYVKDWVKRDGKVHPSYNLFGTSSFRISGSNPNLTQLPREKHGYNVRTCYVAGEGYVFISFDFSSAEVKILANMANEPAMMQAIADGMDFHTFSASAIFGIAYEDIKGVLDDETHPLYKEYKGYRQFSKTITFSILYGASVAGICNSLGVEEKEGLRMIALYFDKFPKIREFIDNAHAEAKLKQYVITPLGQRKREYGTHKCFKGTAAYNAALRNSQNVLIQSTTSSIGLVTFAELNRQIKPYGATSICTVYDSIEIKCPIDRAAEVINLAYKVLNEWPVENFDFMKLPIGCDGDVGISWGESLKVHPGTTTEDVLAILEKVKAESIGTFGELLP